MILKNCYFQFGSPSLVMCQCNWRQWGFIQSWTNLSNKNEQCLCSIQLNVTARFLQRWCIQILWNNLFFIYVFMLHQNSNCIEKSNYCIEKAEYSFPLLPALLMQRVHSQHERRGIWQFWWWNSSMQSYSGRMRYTCGEKPTLSLANEANSPCIWGRGIKTHIQNEDHRVTLQEQTGRDLP